MNDSRARIDVYRRRRVAGRSSALGLILGGLLLLSDMAVALNEQCDSWPAWQRFKQLYLSEDGRIVDASSPEQATVSEGQAYALFFSLVANDPPTFRKLPEWTTNNLAQGDLTRSLPAWRWGRDDDGT